MSISFFCQGCKSSVKMTQKKCEKCATPIPKKGRKYRVHVRVNGKQKTRIVDNLDLAREVETTFKAAAIRGEFDIKKKTRAVSLQDFWDKKYLSWMKGNKKSWYVDQCNFNKHIGPMLGKKTLDQITQFDIESFVLSLKKKKNKSGIPLSAATIKHQLILLNRILNIALQWGEFTGQNPCKRVEKPKLNNTIVAFLSNDEITSLTNILNEWPDLIPAAVIRFALFTGVRRSEIFKLEWRDIDLEQETMTLRDPKGKKDQILPLSPQAKEVLENVPREFETPFIFYSTNGAKRVTIRHTWTKIKEAAGLPKSFRFHDLRHNYASHLVSNGVSLYAVQALLTHKDAKTTQKYAHLNDDALRQAANLSGKLLDSSKNQCNVINIKGVQNGK